MVTDIELTSEEAWEQAEQDWTGVSEPVEDQGHDSVVTTDESDLTPLPDVKVGETTFTSKEYVPILGTKPPQEWELAGYTHGRYFSPQGKKDILEDVQRSRTSVEATQSQLAKMTPKEKDNWEREQEALSYSGEDEKLSHIGAWAEKWKSNVKDNKFIGSSKDYSQYQQEFKIAKEIDERETNIAQSTKKTTGTAISAKKALSKANTAREKEKEEGKTVHTIAYHLKRENVATAQRSLGGKAYVDMSPVEKTAYVIKVKAGETSAKAARDVTKPIKILKTGLPGSKNISAAELQVLNELKGKQQYNRLLQLGLISADTKFIEGSQGAWSYIPNWHKVIKKGQQFVELAPAKVAEKQRLQELTQKVQAQQNQYLSDLEKVEKYRIGVSGGKVKDSQNYDIVGILSDVNIKNRPEIITRLFGKDTLELAKEYRLATARHIMTTPEKLREMTGPRITIGAAPTLPAEKPKKQVQMIAYSDTATPKDKKEGKSDFSLQLPLDPKEYIKQVKLAQGEKGSPELTLQRIGLELIPFYGRFLEYERVKSDGLTPKEMATLAGNTLLDTLVLLPVLGGISAGSRAAPVLGAAGKLKAIGKATKAIAIAEVKAPYTMIRHPIKTLKIVASPIETVFRTNKIPLSATEIRSSTVRLPANAFTNETEAMKIRNLLTVQAIKGKEKPTAVSIGGTKVTLNKTAIQNLGEPIAIHSTADIRPFMEGVVVKKGREGGLFVAPNLHTRFTTASAFGDMPKGGIKGGLLIKDPELLKYLSPTGKIFKKNVEIEALFKAGLKLPSPSQMLITRDAGGDKLVLLVFGKPYTAKQVIQLKIMGTTDTIKQIFSEAAKIKKGDLSIAQYDELIDLRLTVNNLTKEAKSLRKRGKITEAVRRETKAENLRQKASRIANRLNERRIVARIPLRVAATNTQRVGNLEKWERITSPDRVLAKPNTGIREVRDIFIPQRAIIRIPSGAPGTRLITNRPQLSNSRVELQLTKPRIPSKAPARIMPPTQLPGQLTKPRIPSKAPARIMPSTRLPGQLIKPLVDVKIPTKPFTKPPPTLIIPKPSQQVKKIIKSKSGLVPITWKQGFVWWTIKPPYKSRKDITVKKTPPDNAIRAKGPGSAFKTIQALGGNTDILLSLDIGAFDIKLITQDKQPRLKFKRDIKQKTKSQVTLKGIRG